MGRYLELLECPACGAAWMWAWWPRQNRWERLYRERFPYTHELGGMGLLERLDHLKQLNRFFKISVCSVRQLTLPLFSDEGDQQ